MLITLGWIKGNTPNQIKSRNRSCLKLNRTCIIGYKYVCVYLFIYYVLGVSRPAQPCQSHRSYVLGDYEVDYLLLLISVRNCFQYFRIFPCYPTIFTLNTSVFVPDAEREGHVCTAMLLDTFYVGAQLFVVLLLGYHSSKTGRHKLYRCLFFSLQETSET